MYFYASLSYGSLTSEPGRQAASPICSRLGPPDGQVGRVGVGAGRHIPPDVVIDGAPAVGRVGAGAAGANEETVGATVVPTKGGCHGSARTQCPKGSGAQGSPDRRRAPRVRARAALPFCLLCRLLLNKTVNENLLYWAYLLG